MKKILVIFFVISTSIAMAQTSVNVKYVTDTVDVGDSVKINFNYSNCPSGYKARLQLWTATYLQDCLYVPCENLSSYPTDGDGTTYIKVKITPAMGTGDARIYSNATPGGYKPFYIRGPVGIAEYDINSEVIKTELYDILGNKIPEKTSGVNIRVVYYSNGYAKAEKIFSP